MNASPKINIYIDFYTSIIYIKGMLIRYIPIFLLKSNYYTNVRSA